jgi:hypothetical protein
VLNSNLLLFAATYGGHINLASDAQNNWIPIESFFTLDLTPVTNCNYNNQQILKGIVKIQGSSQSLANRLYSKIKKKFFNRV